MRIGFLTTEFVTEPNFAGGLANYVYRVGRLLTERGHEVHVVTHSSQNNDEFVYDGIFVHRVMNSCWRWRLNRLFFHRIPRTCRALDFSFRAFRCLRKLHAKTPFDVLQVPNIEGCGLFSLLLLGVPHVVRISGYSRLLDKFQGREGVLDHKLCAILERVQCRKARNVFAPSRLLKRIFTEELDMGHVDTIPTPFFIDVEEFDSSVHIRHLDGKAYLLFFAGRLINYKGPQVLAKALPGVFAVYPDLLAVFVGSDVNHTVQSMRHNIRTLCGPFEDRLLFFDPLTHSQLYPLIEHAEVVVLPSLIDNMPNTCLEAMGLGAIVIGTAGTSFEEVIINGVNGFLVETGNAGELENVLLQVLATKDKKLIRQAAKESIKRFAPEKTINQLESYYHDVISGGSNKA